MGERLTVSGALPLQLCLHRLYSPTSLRQHKLPAVFRWMGEDSVMMYHPLAVRSRSELIKFRIQIPFSGTRSQAARMQL